MVLALQQQESIEGRPGTGEADRGSQSHERDMRAGGKGRGGTRYVDANLVKVTIASAS